VPPRGLVSEQCGTFKDWLPKEQNKDKRKNNNAEWLGKWRARGELRCHICWLSEQETKAHFTIDHIQSLEDGGTDTFANSRPLCADCHTIRTALRSHARHSQQRSARNGRNTPSAPAAMPEPPPVPIVAPPWGR
jgi:hypothetical protein